MLVSLPHGCPAERLRPTLPHALTSSDTIKRCVAVQPPEMKINQSGKRAKSQVAKIEPERDSTVSLRSRNSGHLQPINSHASAPHIGAERLNLMTAPSLTEERNSEETLDRNGAGIAPRLLGLKHRPNGVCRRCSQSLVNHWPGGRGPEGASSSGSSGRGLVLRPIGYTRCQREVKENSPRNPFPGAFT